MADQSGDGEERRRGVAVPLRRRKPLSESAPAGMPPSSGEAAPQPRTEQQSQADRMDFGPSRGGEAAPPPSPPHEVEPADLPPPPPPKPPKSSKPATRKGGGRRPSKGGMVALAGLLVLGAMGLGGYYYWQYSQREAASDAAASAASGSIRAAQSFFAGRLDDARNLAQRAIADAQAAGTPDAVPLAEAVLGRIELEQNQAAQGRARLQSVLDRFNSQTAPLSIAVALEGLGKDAATGRDDARAIELLNQAAQAYDVAGQAAAARSARLSATEIAARSNDPALARVALQRALDDARANGDSGSIARILTALAELSDRQGAPDRLDRLGEAANALAASNRTAEAARLRLRIASLQEEGGDKDGALASLKQVITELGSVPGSGTVVRNAYRRASDMARDLGHFDEERSLRGQAIEVTRASGEAVPLITVLADTAQRDLSMGYFSDSLARAQEAAEAADALNDPRGAGKAWADAALAAIRLGNLPLAQASLNRSQSSLEKVGEPAMTAFLGVRRGVLLANNGKLDEALSAYQQSAAIFDRIGEERNKGVALMNAADVLWRMDRASEAEAMLNQAEAIFSKTGFDPGLDFALEQRGQIALAEGDRAGGISRLETALAAHKAAGRWFNAATLAMQLGGLAAEDGGTTAAQLQFEEAETLYRKLGLAERQQTVQDAIKGLTP